MIQVKLKDGRTLDLPDGLSTDEIREAVAAAKTQGVPDKATEQPSELLQVLRTVSTLGGAFPSIPAGIMESYYPSEEGSLQRFTGKASEALVKQIPGLSFATGEGREAKGVAEILAREAGTLTGFGGTLAAGGGALKAAAKAAPALRGITKLPWYAKEAGIGLGTSATTKPDKDESYVGHVLENTLAFPLLGAAGRVIGKGAEIAGKTAPGRKVAEVLKSGKEYLGEKLLGIPKSEAVTRAQNALFLKSFGGDNDTFLKVLGNKDNQAMANYSRNIAEEVAAGNMSEETAVNELRAAIVAMLPDDAAGKAMSERFRLIDSLKGEREKIAVPKPAEEGSEFLPGNVIPRKDVYQRGAFDQYKAPLQEAPIGGVEVPSTAQWSEGTRLYTKGLDKKAWAAKQAGFEQGRKDLVLQQLEDAVKGGTFSEEELGAIKNAIGPDAQRNIVSDLQLAGLYSGAKEGHLARAMDWVLRSSEGTLKKLGPEGVKLAELLRTYEADSRAYKGYIMQQVAPILKKHNPTKEEFETVTKMLGGQQPIDSLNPGVAERLEPLRAELKTAFDKLGADLEAAGVPGITKGKRTDFKMLDQYWMNRYSKENWEKIKSPEVQDALADHLVATGAVPTKELATARLRQLMVRKSGVVSGFQHERIPGAADLLREKFGIDVERKPIDFFNHVAEAGNKVVQARLFGPKGEKLQALIDTMEQKGIDVSVAKTIVDRMIGADVENSAISRGLAAVRSLMTMTKLSPRTTVLNYFQRFNVPWVTSAEAFKKGWLQSRTEEGKKLAREALGLPEGYETERLMDYISSGIGDLKDPTALNINEWAGKALKLYGFTGRELKNRYISVNSGAEFAKDVLAKLLKNPNDRVAVDQLKSLGINPLVAMKRKSLTRDELIKAGQAVDKASQFWYSKMDLPVGWGSEVGKTVFQFKPAAYQQFQMFRRIVTDAAKHGNVLPLIGLLATTVATGELVSDVRQVLMAKDVTQRPSGVARILEDLNYGAGLGLASDTANMFLQGSPRWFPGYFFGPAAGSLVEYAGNVQQAASGAMAGDQTKYRPLARQLLKEVSTPLANILLPPKRGAILSPDKKPVKAKKVVKKKPKETR